MNSKEKDQYLYIIYKYTRDFDFSKLNKYKKADDELCISDLILDYTMLYERYKERTKKLQKEKQKLEKIIIEQDEEQRKLFNHIVKDDYKPRLDKAIEYIENQLESTRKCVEYHMEQYNASEVAKYTRDCKLYANILEILEGEDNE